jgi:hypothetical protein
LIILDVVEFETTIDKRKKKPVAVNITPASPEIIGENRVEGTIAVVARQQQHNGVSRKKYFFFLIILYKNFIYSFINLILCQMEK